MSLYRMHFWNHGVPGTMSHYSGQNEGVAGPVSAYSIHVCRVPGIMFDYGIQDRGLDRAHMVVAGCEGWV
jgi:hypothetical protein